jgi:hypothetical protein
LIVDPSKLSDSLFIETNRFPKKSCAVVEGAIIAGWRTLLRFTTTTPNLGPGELFVGLPDDHPEWFEFDTCHGHSHFREYADYRLWTPEGYAQWQAVRAASPGACASDLLAGNAKLATTLTAGHKQGFCVIDLVPYLEPPCPIQPEPSYYFYCAYQGISVCWSDEYHWSIDGQWIDVTSIPDGPYVLEIEVNAERFFQEADYSNNSTAIPITIVKPRNRARR